MNQSNFLTSIRICRARMNIAAFLKMLVSALCVGAGAGIIFQAVAFVIPLYYARVYTIVALTLAIGTAFVLSVARRASMAQAALKIDSFGFDERIVTAYEGIRHNKNDAFAVLQREDAMKQLDAHRDRIRIPLMPSWKGVAFLLSLLIIMTGLSFLPSKMKEYAKGLHAVKEEASEKEEEIEEIAEALEQINQEELTSEQWAQMQEMIESLQSSMEEYKQAVSQEMLSAASEKLNYKYEYINSQLSDLAQSLQNGAQVSAATVESMEAMAQKLKEMTGQELAKDDGTGNNGSGGQNGENDGNGGQGGDGGSDGEGNGNDNGSGDGTGNNGSGGQNGDGETGNGRGTGSSSNPHDYVSIPNAIADSGNLTGNAVNHDASEYFYAPNGLSWEGTRMSYEAVIGSYEQNAYEGIAAGKYPSGMEEIIKEYFSGFD